MANPQMRSPDIKHYSPRTQRGWGLARDGFTGDVERRARSKDVADRKSAEGQPINVAAYEQLVADITAFTTPLHPDLADHFNRLAADLLPDGMDKYPSQAQERVVRQRLADLKASYQQALGLFLTSYRFLAPGQAATIVLNVAELAEAMVISATKPARPGKRGVNKILASLPQPLVGPDVDAKSGQVEKRLQRLLPILSLLVILMLYGTFTTACGAANPNLTEPVVTLIEDDPNNTVDSPEPTTVPQSEATATNEPEVNQEPPLSMSATPTPELPKTTETENGSELIAIYDVDGNLLPEDQLQALQTLVREQMDKYGTAVATGAEVSVDGMVLQGGVFLAESVKPIAVGSLIYYEVPPGDPNYEAGTLMIVVGEEVRFYSKAGASYELGYSLGVDDPQSVEVNRVRIDRIVPTSLGGRPVVEAYQGEDLIGKGRENWQREAAFRDVFDTASFTAWYWNYEQHGMEKVGVLGKTATELVTVQKWVVDGTGNEWRLINPTNPNVYLSLVKIDGALEVPPDNPETKPTPTVAPTKEVVAQTNEIVFASNINLRTGPGTNYPVLFAAQTDSSATVIGESWQGSQRWLLIEVQDQEAWVAGWLVDTTNLQNVPQIDQSEIPTAPEPTPAPVETGPSVDLSEFASSLAEKWPLGSLRTALLQVDGGEAKFTMGVVEVQRLIRNKQYDGFSVALVEVSEDSHTFLVAFKISSDSRTLLRFDENRVTGSAFYESGQPVTANFFQKGMLIGVDLDDYVASTGGNLSTWFDKGEGPNITSVTIHVVAPIVTTR